MKAIFTYDYGAERMREIEELGYDVSIIHEKAIQNSPEVDLAEILVCYNPFQSLNISQMKNLKWIQLSSIGFDQLPKENVMDREILVTNNQGGYSKPMGEWIVMNILEILKHRKTFFQQQQDCTWKLDSGILELVDKRVGFLGTGTIAQEAAKRLQGFEAEIIGFNTSGHDAPYFSSCHPVETFMEVAATLDVLVVTLPHTPATHHFLDGEKMDAMKDGSVLINVSRGPNVVESDLIERLERDKFLGVALDVFEQEPLPAEHPLWKMERVYISPHNSWVSEQKNRRRFEMIKENMRRYREGETLLNRVNIARGY